MAFYGPNGNKITGKKMSGGGNIEAIWEIDIAAAVGRCEQGGSAKQELANLLKKHPMLKEDKWQVGEHPLSPLMDYYVRETMG